MARRVVPLLVSAMLLASCGSGSSSPDTTAPPVSTTEPTYSTGSIAWRDCEDDTSLDCGTLLVPYDYDNLSEGLFTLQLVRRPAGDPKRRIGPMLVNPGGPGYGGNYLARDAESYFSEELLARFDIIGWDPRGTGTSSPAVNCGDTFDPYFELDPSPDDIAEKTALDEANRVFAEKCADFSAELLPWVSTNQSARDMNSIRLALGVDRITYFGFSYGSELGATWATMFPHTVRAAVLDGAVDPSLGFLQSALQQAGGFESQLTAFFAKCAADTECAFHSGGDPVAAFDRLMARLDRVPLVPDKKRVRVNQGVALTGVAKALYSSSQWDALASALSDAVDGDGAALLALFDEYYQVDAEGTYGNEFDAFVAISCIDTGLARSASVFDSVVPQFKVAAPRLWSTFTSSSQCAYWEAPADPRIEVTGRGAGPILVIGTTGDAATPLAGTRAMAGALEDGRLVVVDEDRHTGYGVNECVVSTVDDYLVTTKVSFAEKSC